MYMVWTAALRGRLGLTQLDILLDLIKFYVILANETAARGG